jgi:hypothetical protein
MDRNALKTVLGQVGKPTHDLEFPDGTHLLALPYGGRALGLFPGEAEENFFWTHPALESVKSAGKFYASQAWHNSGGDRTWLGAEADIFFPEFPRLNNYFQPRELDPGDYKTLSDDAGLTLTNFLELTLSRSKARVTLEITKQFSPAPNPLRHERTLRDLEFAYAGYTQRTHLSLLKVEPSAPVQVNLWNLIQLPHGGEMIVPTFGATAPRVLMGTVPPADLKADARAVRYRMTADGEQKISLRAAASTGRAGYVCQRGGGRWDLVARNYGVNPSAEYIDVPWDDTKDFGYATQACNINSGLGQFSELEYHAPAVSNTAGFPSCQDYSQVWAFRAARPGIERVARALLGVEL